MLPYDLAVAAGGVPTAELAKITAPVLILGGKNSRGWFQRSVAEQAAATAEARLKMLNGYDHNAPPEVITLYPDRVLRRAGSAAGLGQPPEIT
jgi:pimeloyl-ACP methyl ester carboxylesterase